MKNELFFKKSPRENHRDIDRGKEFRERERERARERVWKEGGPQKFDVCEGN